jgi:hypothetical protein
VRATLRRWPIAIALAAVLVGTLLLVAARRLPDPSTASPSTAVTPRPSEPLQSSTVVESTTAPTWVGRRQPVWGPDGTKAIAFQLEAVDDVPIWTTRVRPQLVVRCVSRRTEIYVALGSAASYEGVEGRHTIRLQIDNEPEVRQQWSDSASSQELFAPDGVALAARLARAHRLRFGFTPFNARPVAADFIVDGFQAVAPLVERTCSEPRSGQRLASPRQRRG